MYLAQSGATLILKCRCGETNLAFCGSVVEVAGQARCKSCGQAADWQSLRQAALEVVPAGATIHRLPSQRSFA